VLDALTTLPADAAHVLCLRYFDDLPPREIAARLGVPVETVRTRTRRALARLRDELDCRHGGDRAAWGVALAPLVRAGVAAPAPCATHPAPSIPSPVETLAVAATAKPLLVAAAAASSSRGVPQVGRRRPTAPWPTRWRPSPSRPARTAAARRRGDGACAAPRADAADGPATGPATRPTAASRTAPVVGASWTRRRRRRRVRVRLVPDDALLVYLGVPVDGRWSALETTTAADGTYGFEGSGRGRVRGPVRGPGKAMAVRGGSRSSPASARLDDLALADGATCPGTVRGTASGTVGGTVWAPTARRSRGRGSASRSGRRTRCSSCSRAWTGCRGARHRDDGRRRPVRVAHVAEGRAVLVVEAPGHASKVLALTVPARALDARPHVAGHRRGERHGARRRHAAVGARVLVTRDGGSRVRRRGRR
jgi:hypothetical protein